MRIVLTNDDGIEAAGLLAARRALEEVGEVLTVAPDRNRSGVGRAISFGSPLHVEERKMADGAVGYACSGTPVDCVRLVALGLMDFEPDLVVSGINHGENLGDDITYSGTVAAAFEGIVIGVPGIAVSLAVERPWHHHDEAEIHFEPVAIFAARVTKLGRRFYTDELIAIEDEKGRIGYDIYNNPPGRHEEEGTDFAAVEAGEISVTPVHLKLTDEPGLEELDSWNVKSLLCENGSS